jgi:hypothetical protein
MIDSITGEELTAEQEARWRAWAIAVSKWQLMPAKELVEAYLQWWYLGVDLGEIEGPCMYNAMDKRGYLRVSGSLNDAGHDVVKTLGLVDEYQKKIDEYRKCGS